MDAVKVAALPTDLHQEAIAGYRQFDQLIQEYVDQMVEKTRAEIAADSKKNQSLPQNSSSAKMRKSSS